MEDSSQGGKVIPFARGLKKGQSRQAERRQPDVIPKPGKLPLTRMLESLHPRVQAVLVAREGKWELFERGGECSQRRSILATISLPELLRILEKSSASASVAFLAQGPQVLQAPRRPEDHPLMRDQRITLSPWPGFDLALLLREGTPRYALCLDPDTSIYVAEEALPQVARFFDEAADKDPAQS
ncbi:MAG: hypothetical protein KIT83_02325 [Bryobacterales bacterium]|nr:hypothetical protein [Bryobacterales bacterium]